MVRVDSVLPDGGFWEGKVTIDIRQNLLVQTMKINQEVRETMFGALRAHLVHFANMKITRNEYLEILLEKLSVYVGEIYTSVEAQNLRFKEGDHDHPFMLYRVFTYAIFLCMVFNANGLEELEAKGRVMVGHDEVWERVQRLSPFKTGKKGGREVGLGDCLKDEKRLFESFDGFTQEKKEKKVFVRKIFLFVFYLLAIIHLYLKNISKN